MIPDEIYNRIADTVAKHSRDCNCDKCILFREVVHLRMDLRETKSRLQATREHRERIIDAASRFLSNSHEND